MTNCWNVSFHRQQRWSELHFLRRNDERSSLKGKKNICRGETAHFYEMLNERSAKQSPRSRSNAVKMLLIKWDKMCLQEAFIQPQSDLGWFFTKIQYKPPLVKCILHISSVTTLTVCLSGVHSLKAVRFPLCQAFVTLELQWDLWRFFYVVASMTSWKNYFLHTA